LTATRFIAGNTKWSSREWPWSRRVLGLVEGRRLGDHVGQGREAVEERRVLRVDHVLGHLQPVALVIALLGPVLAVVAHEHVVGRDHRRFTLAHIGPDDAVAVLAGITRDLDVARQRRAVGLAGLVDALAGLVVQPAVVAAADARLLDRAERHRGVAVRAFLSHEPRLAVEVAVQHQILAQDADLLRLVAEIGRHLDRYPVVAEQLAGRVLGADADQPLRDLRRGAERPRGRRLRRRLGGPALARPRGGPARRRALARFPALCADA
jgi:hypothetical protein